MNYELQATLEKAIEAEKPMHKIGCPTVGYQDVEVSVPVTVKAFAEVGNAKTQCLGKATVSSHHDCDAGRPGAVCKFTISQKLRVEVPVVFGAKAEVGDASIDCGCAKGSGYEDSCCR